MKKDILKVTSNQVSKTGEYILTASMPVGCTCDVNAPCYQRKECYAMRGNLAFNNYKAKMESNLRLYEEYPDVYVGSIQLELNFIRYKYFRWFVSGDIPDRKFLSDVMIKLARDNPEVKFLAFTKKYRYVNDYLNSGNEIPSNLQIVFSCWGSFHPQSNEYKLPCSYVRYKANSPYVTENEFIPEEAKPCEGKCARCLKCWNLKKGESVVFNKH